MWDIGVDIVEVQRFKRLDYANHKVFYERIFTPKEIEYCLSFRNAAKHFASTFAGKEAVYKAINRWFKLGLKEIEIVRVGGAPEVNLMPKKGEKIDKPISKVNVKVSLSHTESYAVAFAIAMFEEPK